MSNLVKFFGIGLGSRSSTGEAKKPIGDDIRIHWGEGTKLL